MKALTICQPYAELIMRCPVKGTPFKRVENRTWATSYRGPLVIHAGKSREWLHPYHPYEHDPELRDVQRDRTSGIDLAEMDFGAILGVVDLIDCLPIADIESGACDERYPWIRTHEHCNGPYCFVLDNVRRLPKPIPYSGKQGFFNVPDELLQQAVSHV